MEAEIGGAEHVSGILVRVVTLPRICAIGTLGRRGRTNRCEQVRTDGRGSMAYFLWVSYVDKSLYLSFDWRQIRSCAATCTRYIPASVYETWDGWESGRH